MKNDKKLFILELPPPTHGVTYINKIIYHALKDKENFHFYNMDYSSAILEIGQRNIKKIFHNIKLLLGVWKSYLVHNPATVYYVLSATKFGIMRDLAILFPMVVLRKKKILHLHGFTYFDIYEHSRLYRILFNIITSKSKLIVLCKKQKEQAKLIFKLNSYVLYNSLEATINNNSRKIRNDKIRLLYISNISRHKGTLDLMKSIENLDNVTLTIAGNFWTDEKEFKELLLKMKDKVKYIGFAAEEKKKELLSTHDIFCIPSRLSEGSPVSIIEALSYGLPIIGTNKGCISEMIKNCGYIVEGVLNENKMNDALQQIQNNYETYSKKAINDYKKLYSKENFISKLENIICAE